STGCRRDRHCPPCVRPSSNSSLDHRRSDARAAENGFAAKSSVNKSAKVVLGRVLINAQIAAGYALTLRLHHHWYLATGTSAYGCPKNDTLRVIDDGTL